MGKPGRKVCFTFAQWKERVDLWCREIAGLSRHDFSDADYAKMFDDGYSPERAARKALREAGYPC